MAQDYPQSDVDKLLAEYQNTNTPIYELLGVTDSNQRMLDALNKLTGLDEPVLPEKKQELLGMMASVEEAEKETGVGKLLEGHGGGISPMPKLISFAANTLTEVIKGVRDAGHIIAKKNPLFPDSGLSPEFSKVLGAIPGPASLINQVLPIDTTTEEGKKLQNYQDNLVNTGLGLAMLGEGIEIDGNIKDTLSPRGLSAYTKLLNDPEVHLDRKKFESEIAEMGVEIASFLIPFTTAFKAAGSIPLITKAAQKLSKGKWNKRARFGPTGTGSVWFKPQTFERYLKSSLGLFTANVAAIRPYEDNTIAWGIADHFGPFAWEPINWILESISVEADDSLATAYGKFLLNDALIAAPFMTVAGAYRRTAHAFTNKKLNAEAINRLGFEVANRQAASSHVNMARVLARSEYPAVRETLEDPSVARLLPKEKENVKEPVLSRIRANIKTPGIIAPYLRRHLTTRRGMTEQQFQLYTTASNNEKNIGRYIDRETQLLEEQVENIVSIVDSPEALKESTELFGDPLVFGTEARGKLWGMINDVMMDKAPIESLPGILRETVGNARRTVDNLTVEILESPTLPDFVIKQADVDTTVSDLIEGWAAGADIPLNEAITQTKNINFMDTDIVKAGEELVMPNLRAVLVHNLGSHLRRSFKLHQVVPTAGQYIRRGLETVRGVPYEERTSIGYAPSSRIKLETFDYLINQEFDNFGKFASPDGRFVSYKDLLEKLEQYNPALFHRTLENLKDQINGSYVKDADGNNVWVKGLNLKDKVQLVSANMFDDAANTQINEILAGSGVTPTELFNNSYLFGKSVSSTGRAIFTHRKDIADPILTLMGEINDPRRRMIDTVSKMAHWVEQDKYLRKVKEIGEGIYLGSKNSRNPDWVHEIDMPTTALHGMRTTKELADVFSSANKVSNNIHPMMRYFVNPLIKRPKGWAQRAATVLNIPMTHARNIGGSGIMFMSNGWMMTPRLFMESFKETVAELRRLKPRQLDATIQKYSNLGVINTNVRTGQIRELLADREYEEGFKDFDNWWHYSKWRKSAEEVKGFNQKLDDIYTAEDNIFKIMEFKKERDFLRSVYRDDPKGEMPFSEKSLDEIDFEAAAITKDVMPNYATIPGAFRSLRNVPFGNFFSFRFEEIRTAYNILNRAVFDELPDPRLRSRGLKRLAGWLGGVGVGGTGVATMWKMLNNITREEELGTRETVPEWSKDSNILPIRNEDGVIDSYIDLSYSMPYDAWQRWLPTVFRAVAEGTLSRDSLGSSLAAASGESAWDMVEPFVQEDIYGRPILDIIARGGYDRDGRAIFDGPWGDRPFENTYKSIAHVMKGFVPGGVKSYNRIYKGFKGDYDDYYRHYNPWVELAGVFTGVRVQPIDFDMTIRTSAIDFREEANAADRLFTRSLTADTPTDDIVKAYEKANNNRYKAFVRMAKTVRGMQILGHSDSDILELLKDKGGVGGPDALSLVLNSYRRLPLTEDRREMIEDRSRRVPPGNTQIEMFDILSKIQEAGRHTEGISMLYGLPPDPEKRERSRRAGGGPVDIPRATPEPDERIDPILGQPYNRTAGLAYQDEDERTYA